MALSLGGLIGALGFAVLSKVMSKRATMLTAVSTLGVAMTVIAFLPPLPMILALCAVVGLVYGPIAPIYNYVMQTRAPAHLRGRVVGVMDRWPTPPDRWADPGRPLPTPPGYRPPSSPCRRRCCWSPPSPSSCRRCGTGPRPRTSRIVTVSPITGIGQRTPRRHRRHRPRHRGRLPQDRAADPDAGTATAVIRPRTTEEVQTVLRWATRHRVAVVPRGAGTGLSGGSTAVTGGVVLSTEKMRDITVDPVTRTAVVQPGLLNAEVKKAVAEYGLWYPPDPSSYEICSIGGNIATNAGGLCCVKYGVTTDYVLGLQVVLADGTAVRLGGPRLKDVAGLSLTKLFVGSEGTLGVITEVTLRLLPPQPHACTVVASFSSVRAACDAVGAVSAKIRPAMLEFMDAVSINAVEDKLKMGLDRSAAAMLVAASDERGPTGAEDAEFMARGVQPNTVPARCFRQPIPTRARRLWRPGASASGGGGQGVAAARGRGGAAVGAGRSGGGDREDGRRHRVADLGDRARR
jgi:hypothetical protein